MQRILDPRQDLYERRLYYALMCLVVGVTAGVLHLAGAAAVAVQISWVLFLIGIVLVAIHVIMGRTARVA